MRENFFEAGGYGMYPTTAFGVLLVAAGIAYAVFPERRFVPLLISLGVVVFGSGALGTVTGFITTFQAIQKLPADRQHAVTLMGISESLNNAAWAFVFIVLATLIASAGALRLALKSKATPAHPA
jgi:drug/metabolite transporter (DMT)-like permease